MSYIKFRPAFYLSIAVYLLLVPVSWLSAWLIAAMVHELFHIIALKLCGFSINGIIIGASGAQIKTNAYPGIKMILCAMAGPLSGFLLLILLRCFPRVAICGLVQSLGNLIPMYPLDGGRAFCSILNMIFTNRVSYRIYKSTEVAIVVLLIMIAIYCTAKFNIGIMPVFMMGVFLMKKKYLANNCFSEYNSVNRN